MSQEELSDEVIGCLGELTEYQREGMPQVYRAEEFWTPYYVNTNKQGQFSDKDITVEDRVDAETPTEYWGPGCYPCDTLGELHKEAVKHCREKLGGD
jgi:hypothetical protein